MPGPKPVYYDKSIFIREANKIHNNKYDYSKFALFNSTTKGTIICKECGIEFEMQPWVHLYGGKKKCGSGCPVCANKQRAETLNQGVQLFKIGLKKRKDKGKYYDYSKSEYIDTKHDITIICPEHGEFRQNPWSHIHNDAGCPICSRIKSDLNRRHKWERVYKDICEKRIDNGQYYDYSKVKYELATKPVEIICPVHGSFWQSPSTHKNGAGCPVCKQSKLEEEVREYLIKNKIKFKQHAKFSWLRLQHIDFYLPILDIAIECQGIQHYQPVPIFNKKYSLEDIKKLDARKYNACKKCGIGMYYIKYNETDIEKHLDKIITKAKSKMQ